MRKTLTCLLLILALFCILVPGTLAADSEQTAAADELYALGLFQGVGTDAQGKPVYALDNQPTRNEAVAMLVRLLGKEQEAKNGNWDIPFTDIVSSWAVPYVGYAYTHGLTSGTSATTFGGDAFVSASQYLTFVLRALGYEDGKDFRWDAAWELSDRLGITDGRYRNDSKFFRGDVALISRNALYCNLKNDTVTLLESLGNSSEAVVSLHASHGEWLFPMNIVNRTGQPLQFQELRIVDNDGENVKVRPASDREFIDNVRNHTGVDFNKTLAPSSILIWTDGHPYVDWLRSRNYIYTFTDPQGKAYTYTFRYTLLPEESVSYAGDTSKDLERLRHDADYCVEVGEGIYWVPAASLGGTRYTNDEIWKMRTDTPEEKQRKISTLYEALQLYQISAFRQSEDNIHYEENGLVWEFHKPGYDAVRTNTGCCATDSDWLRYLLDGDYDEIGFIATSQPDASGHVFNYILQDGWYYIVDLMFLYGGFPGAVMESGDLQDFYAVDRIHGVTLKTKDLKYYADYVVKNDRNHPAMIFRYTADHVLDICGDRASHMILYPIGPDITNVYCDPAGGLSWKQVPKPQYQPDWSINRSFDFASMGKGL